MNPVITHRRIGVVMVAVALVDVALYVQDGNQIRTVLSVVFGLLGLFLIVRNTDQ